MFVSEIRETRCRYAGAMSEISGHGRPQGLAFGQKRGPSIASDAAFILFLLASRISCRHLMHVKSCTFRGTAESFQY